MSIVSRRNGEIELMRFIMALLVVMRHVQECCHTGSRIMGWGSMAVEFFFLLSGYLMLQSIQKMPPAAESLSCETWRFLRRKISSLLPEVVIAGVVALCVFLIFSPLGAVEKMTCVVAGIFNDIFLLRAFALERWTGINGPVWYISAMLIGMSLLFPLIRKWGCTPWLLVLTLLGMGCMIHQTACFRDPPYWFGICYKGVCRALCDMSLGAFAYGSCLYVKGFQWTKIGQVCTAVIKWAIMAGLLSYMCFFGFIACDGIFVICLWVYVVLVFSRIPVDSFFYDCKISYWLGKISLPLYVCHWCVIEICNVLSSSAWSVWDKNAFVVIVSIICACGITGLAALWRKYEQRVIALFVV